MPNSRKKKIVWLLFNPIEVEIEINAWSPLFVNLKIILIFKCLYTDNCLKFNQLKWVSRIPNSQSKAGKLEIFRAN